MPKARNIITRKDLTQYAYGLMQDIQEMLELARLLAPVVPTGATHGAFNKFDDTQAFKFYNEIVARRAIGGKAQAIELLSTTGNYALEPYGLRIAIDEHERAMAADGLNLLEQGKTRTLTVNCALSYLMHVVNLVRNNVSAESGKGDWGNPNVDPIAELDALIEAIWKATGMVPNNIVFDFGAWIKLRGNPNVKKYMPGADLARITTERVQGLLANPNARVRVVMTSILDGGGLANTSATKKGALSGSVLAFYNSDVASIYDPSFAKCFALTQQLFTEVYTYREEPHLEWIENDWTCQPQVVAPSLCKRIDVS